MTDNQNKSKGTPKRDGTGRGVGANKGRGGCVNPRGTRQGQRK